VDRTARAKIRDAAIETVAIDGPSGVTARKVAAAAGVSPALLIHHYGSMDSLREECDHYVAAELRRLKSAATAQGASLDLLAALRTGHPLPLARYLAAVLTDDSPAVSRLVDELVADACAYSEQAVGTGMLQPSADPQGRAAVLMLWGLGALVLHRHMERLLGVDPTNPDFGRTPESVNYLAPVYEIYSNGLLAEEFAERARDAMAALADGARSTEEASP